MPDTIESPFLKYNLQHSKSMDYFFLRKEGIRMVQELSGKIWTDYNEHDPGVTILEQICFALTDIAYRTNIDIEKILFPNGNDSSIAYSNALYVPEDILLSSSVTLLDVKMLFLDKIRSINNIWFKKSKNNKFIGLYDIYVQPISSLRNHNEIEKEVLNLFAQNRNLCEDINSIVILQPEDLILDAIIDIYEDLSAEELLAEIYFQLNVYFNYKIKYNSIETLLDNGLTYDEIFDRPSFNKDTGFIDKFRLEDYQTTYSFSNLFSIFYTIKGVRNVQNLIVRKDGIKIGTDQIHIKDGNYASVSAIIENPSFVITKNGLRIDYNKDKVKSSYQQKVVEATKKHQYNPIKKFNNTVPTKNNNSNYTSIQNTFPITYGIGNYGLSGNEGNDRKKAALQLQGYLLFFDQILLNHLAQLNNIADLFSTNEDQIKTYFENSPTTIPSISELIKPEYINFENTQPLYNLLGDKFYERKNKILDHLLARFSEKFVNESHHNLKIIFGLSKNEDINATLVHLKYALLKNYNYLSKNRNKSYNYTSPIWEGNPFDQSTKIIDPDLNLYPFKMKLFLLLNLPIQNIGMVSLIQNDNFGIKMNTVSNDEKNDITVKNSNKKSSYFKTYQDKNFKKATFVFPESLSVVDNLVYYGSKYDSYFISNELGDGNLFKLFFKSIQESIPTAIAEFDSFEEANRGLEKLCQKFSDLNKKSEGFHVAEHILLRPLLDDQFQLEISIENKINVFFTSVNTNSFEYNKILLRDICILGTKKENFTIEANPNPKIGENDFTIYLKDKMENNLLKLNLPFLSILIAQTYIEEKLVVFFNLLSKDRSFIPSSVQIKPIDNDKLQTDLNGFFNSQISLIFPNWLPRFNEPDFKELLNHSILNCLPANLKINKIWLGKNDMKAFELLFFEWNRLKSEICSDKANLKYTNKGEAIQNRKENLEFLTKKSKLDTLSLSLITILNKK